MTDKLAELLAVVGDRWALLIVREVAVGVRRFDELQAGTGAPRQVLSDRLRRLSAAGLLVTRPYQVPGRRSRNEYMLTDSGIDLLPVLSGLSDWAQRHLAEGALPEIVYRHSMCGGRVSATLQCECGEPADPHGRVIAENRR
ncbi:helix-turn-helix domain-containing protein [Phytomonospora sp. NPDC050363]|uniref:winged helix-turn-helix transcriptional regulator n=1 Tax=Phytomonospora sp. NPDC050363 TaxID=3155642 RepID=UPI0033DF019F